MAQAKRDDNFITVGLGWDATNSTTLPFKVDPSTGRLLITISGLLSGSPTVTGQPLDGDENRVPVSAGTGDDGTAAVIPLHIHTTSGYLAVDLV